MNIFSNCISYIGKVHFRADNRIFGINQIDRLVGMHIIGKTGTGKTTLIENLIMQDIYASKGVLVLDITGDLSRKIISNIHENRKSDVIYLDTTNPNLELGYNPIRKVSQQYRHLVASHMLEVLERIWGSSAWGNRIEYILRNAILAILDQPNPSFYALHQILTSDDFRGNCIQFIESAEVKDFWINQFPKYSKSDILPVLNKIGGIITIPIVKKILVSNTKQISFDNILNTNKILIVNLAKGSIGADAAHLLGSLILGTVSTVAYQRINISESERKPFFVYLDEFHNFTTESLVNMFAELRKFKIGFITAHQFLNQIPEKIRDSILGNVGTLICFRLSYADAIKMEKEFQPTVEAKDILFLENYIFYIKLLINGKQANPFSALVIKHEELGYQKFQTTFKNTME